MSQSLRDYIHELANEIADMRDLVEVMSLIVTDEIGYDVKARLSERRNEPHATGATTPFLTDLDQLRRDKAATAARRGEQ